ncbi:MAG: O-methyltransferase [Prevotellaceae bacterium]|jgi:predicted O-methyltransferase YrrM|nr:O-methyltransferase [Prevotellaceae bacterium]
MNIDDYILSHLEQEPDYLKAIERKTNIRFINPRMASGHLQGRLLKMLTRIINPQNALEIGTFTGYSALCIAEGLSESAHLHTIEIDDELEDFIRRNFQNSPFERKITLHIGNALDIIPIFGKEFDLVFIDADKCQYWEYFETVLPKVRKGGFIIVDNTLWNGKIVQPVQHGDKRTKSIIDFNRRIAADNRIEQLILPLRDGLTLIMKK